MECFIYFKHFRILSLVSIAQIAGTVEYTDYFSAEE